MIFSIAAAQLDVAPIRNSTKTIGDGNNACREAQKTLGQRHVYITSLQSDAVVNPGSADMSYEIAGLKIHGHFFRFLQINLSTAPTIAAS